MRLYHPELDTVWEGPDDDDLFAVMAESGWAKTIPPEQDNPAHAAEQPGAVYQLVNPAPEPAKKISSSSKKSTSD